MRKMAYVVTVSSIEPIEGKDRIVYIGFKENTYKVIAKKGVKVGDKLAYFEVDSILPVRNEFEFLRGKCFKQNLNGFKISAMKMFGLYSMGITFTLEDLGLKNSLKPETDLTEILNIRKFEPEDDQTPKENKDINIFKKFLYKHRNLFFKFKILRPIGRLLFVKKKDYKTFPLDLIMKSDENNLSNNKFFFDNKTKGFYATIKIEGQSVTLTYRPSKKEFNIFGRNTLGTANHFSYFKSFNSKEKIADFLKKNGIKEAIAIQGEFISNKVQNGIYGIGDGFYVFKVTIGGKVLSYHDMMKVCESIGYTSVPLFIMKEKDTIKDTFKNIEALQDIVEHIWFKVGTNPIEFVIEEEYEKMCKELGIENSFSFKKKKELEKSKDFHRSEGLVLRDLQQNSFSFKVKSLEYQLKN